MTTPDPNSIPRNRRYLRVVLRYWWAVIGCALLAGAAAFGISKTQTKSYTASAILLFQDQSPTEQATGLASSGSTNDPVGQRATNLLLVQQSGNLAARAASQVRGIGANQVRAAVTATQPGDANVIAVTASWPSPTTAAKIANAYANAFVRQEQLNNQSNVQSAINLVQGQLALLPSAEQNGTASLNLRNELESLRILKSMQGAVRVIRTAVAPSSPTSPRISRNVVIGVVIGLVIGLLVAARLGRADRRIRDVEEVRTALDLPVLGVIPHTSSRVRTEADPAATEAFRMLRGYLRYFNVDNDNRVLLVISAEAAEGKTTVARGLALAAAQLGTRTLLLEADLRRPSIAQTFGWGPSLGLTDALIGMTEADLERSIRRVDTTGEIYAAPSQGNNGAVHRLDVLLAGSRPPNPAELLESHAMESVLGWAADRYEFVVVDSAPLLAVSDSLPLIEKVNGTLVVARLGRTSFEAAGLLRERLDSLGANVIGAVVNDYRASASGYAYGYGSPTVNEQSPQPAEAPAHEPGI
jgi:succinoglycan biosynthesis transport protein ExoP